ncbi:MAG TPA: response regulator [Candidatus Obscuribacterales bacterium]
MLSADDYYRGMEAPRILVVEDNPTMQKVVTLFAARKGIYTVAVGSCREAIDQIRNGSAFGLIFMDWSLPDRSGLECTSLIREFHEAHHGVRVPIVAMTANLMAGDRERCLAAGMDDFLGKPFGMSEFYQKIEKWMRVPGTVIPFHEDSGPQAEAR